jgi:hypothetical protein
MFAQHKSSVYRRPSGTQKGRALKRSRSADPIRVEPARSRISAVHGI